MFSRKAKELVLARERLQTLTPEELTEVSGGCGEYGGYHREYGGYHREYGGYHRYSDCDGYRRRYHPCYYSTYCG
jgi:hypothetical protein